MFFMLLALVVGIFRLMSETIAGPPFLASLYGLHPILMVFGFIAGVIMTERIAGVELLPSTRETRLSVAMVPLVFAGVAFEALGYGLGIRTATYIGAFLLFAGSALFLFLLLSFYRRSRGDLSLSFMLVSAGALLLSSLLSAWGLPAGNMGFVMVLLLFPIIFVLGERVELTSLASRRSPARLRPALGAVAVILLIFAVDASHLIPEAESFGGLAGFALLAVVFGFVLREERRATEARSEASTPFTRYVSRHISAAYVWGILGSVAGAAYAVRPAFWVYDIFIHSLAIGFVGLMLLAHGPIILPMVLRRNFSHERLSSVPLILLVLALVLRVSGDLVLLSFESSVAGEVMSLSGWVVLLAVIAFLAEVVRGMAGPSKQVPGGTPGTGAA